MGRNIRRKRLPNKRTFQSTKPYIKILIFSIFILLLVLFCLYLYEFYKNKSNYDELSKSADNIIIDSNEISQPTEEVKENEPITFNLTAIGDVMCHNTQYMDAYNSSTGEYDFSYVFEDIKNYIKFSDISVGSLETCFAGEDKGYSNYPTFNSPDSLAYALSDIGIDVLSTAGNHCLDMGFDGLSRTIDVLDNAKISHVGTYKSQEEQNNILIKNVKGINIAFLNCTYGTNGISIPEDKPYCVNLIDRDLIKKHIDLAKSKDVDLIVACMHWGNEYQTTPSNEQKELSDFLFSNGVDIILGNHPHVLQPMEKRTITLEDGTTKDCFVIYASGNFICDQNAENTRNSIILNLNITKNSDGKISINKVTYTPIYMYKNSNLKTKKMKLLDIEKTLSNYENNTDNSIDLNTYNLLKTQLEKINSIVGGRDRGTGLKIPRLIEGTGLKIPIFI